MGLLPVDTVSRAQLGSQRAGVPVEDSEPRPFGFCLTAPTAAALGCSSAPGLSPSFPRVGLFPLMFWVFIFGLLISSAHASLHCNFPEVCRWVITAVALSSAPQSFVYFTWPKPYSIIILFMVLNIKHRARRSQADTATELYCQLFSFFF